MPAVHITRAETLASTRFVAIRVGEMSLALPADAVMEVIRMVALTDLPGSPDWFAGVLNLRGDVVPVVDLPIRLDLRGREHGLATPIVVAQHGSLKFALIVDDVVGLTEGHLAASDTIGSSGSPAIRGIAAMDGVLVPIVDLARLCEDLDGAIPRR